MGCEVGSPKRAPGIHTHQYEKGTLYTLTNNRNINPASCEAEGFRLPRFVLPIGGDSRIIGLRG